MAKIHGNSLLCEKKNKERERVKQFTLKALKAFLVIPLVVVFVKASTTAVNGLAFTGRREKERHRSSSSLSFHTQLTQKCTSSSSS